MEISGYKKRYLYPQTGIIDYQASLSFDNIVGVSSFGFSGESGNNSIEFSAKSGKFYLNESGNSLFLQSYSAGDQVFISGNISPKTHDLFYNNSPLFLGRPKSTGLLNLFYVNSQNVNTDISLNINGDTPNFYYDPFESFFSGQSIPVQITNQSAFPFKIFSGNSLNDNFTLSGANNVSVASSYTLYLNANNFSNGNQSIPIELFTDFGTQNLLFNASGQSLDGLEFYLLFGPNISTILDGNVNSYTIACRSSTGVNLKLDLSYVSGSTGKYYSPIQSTGLYTGNASGFISGSGYVSSLNTGTVYFNNPLTGVETGLGSGILSKFIYSSGAITGTYQASITGLGSGLILSSLTGTGYTNVNINTTITPQGGLVNLQGITGIGTGIDVNGSVVSGVISNGNATVFVPYTGSLNGVQVVIPSGSYENINFTGDLLYYTGQISKFYNITGVTYVTGEIITGLLQGDFGNIFEPGIYTFYKGFTGLGSGIQHVLESFDPINFSVNLTGTSGIISGTFSNTVDATKCAFDLSNIIPSGLPSIIYGPTGNVTYPLSIFHLEPNNTGEYVNENSFGTGTRTSITRNGVGPSGSGYFDNVFREPFYGSGIWTEYISGNISGITGTTKAYINNLNVGLQMVSSTGLSGYFNISGDNNYYQVYKWLGGVTSGDFNDYALEIYKQVGGSGSLLKRFSSSYNIDLILNNGTYYFNIIPIKNSQEVPSLLLPSKYYLSSYEKQSNISSILTKSIDNDIYLSLSGENNTAIGGVHYSIDNSLVKLDKSFGIKYLPVSLLSEPASDVKFYLHVNYLSGGKIYNSNSLQTVEVNILKTEYGESLYPSVANGGCCPSPTGISTVTCQSYLGNNILTSDTNGVFSYFIKFPRPLSKSESLFFYNKFQGKNDIYSLDALLSNSSPVNLYTSTSTQDTNIDTLNSFNIPSDSYGLRYTVLGGALNVNNNRSNWINSFYCNSVTSGTTGCNLSVSSVRVVSDNPMNNGFIINKNGVNLYSGSSLDVTLSSGINLGDYFEIYTQSDKLSPFSVVVNYSGGTFYNDSHLFNGAADRSGSVTDYNFKVLGIVNVKAGFGFNPKTDTWQYQSDLAFGKTPSQNRRSAVAISFSKGIYTWRITEQSPRLSSITLPPIKIGDFTIKSICPQPYDDCFPTGIYIKSLGCVDDDLYVKVGDKYIYDKQLSCRWYSGKSQIWTPPNSLSLSSDSKTITTGITNFNVNLLNGFIPATGKVVYIKNLNNQFSGTITGVSGNPTGYYDSLNMATEFPAGGFLDPAGYPYGSGGKIYGPYSGDRFLYSHSSNPINVDDVFLLNNIPVDGNPYAHVVNGGLTTFLYYLPEGQRFNLNVYNAGGSYGAAGELRLYLTGGLSMSILPEYTSVLPYTGNTTNAWAFSYDNPGIINTGYLSTGFREVSISKSDASLFGTSFAPGTQIDIGCNDGWSPGYKLSTWEAKVLYKQGYYLLTGGKNEVGNTPVAPNYVGNTGQLYYYFYQTPVSYKHPNGGIII